MDTTTFDAVERNAMEKKNDKNDKSVGFRMDPQDFTEFKLFMEAHGSNVSQGVRQAVKQAMADRVRFLLDGEPTP